MLLAQNPRNLSLVTKSHYGKRDVVYGYGSGQSTKWQFSREPTDGRYGVYGIDGLGAVLDPYHDFPPSTNNVDPLYPSASPSSISLMNTDPVNWSPSLSSWVSEINSIMLPAEGRAFNEALSPYTTPFGVVGGDIITWVKGNGLAMLGILGVGLILLPHLFQGGSRRR